MQVTIRKYVFSATKDANIGIQRNRNSSNLQPLADPSPLDRFVNLYMDLWETSLLHSDSDLHAYVTIINNMNSLCHVLKSFSNYYLIKIK